MATNSAIEWTDMTWNPTIGCSIVSPGCTNCYAMKMAARLARMGQDNYRGLTEASKGGPVWSGVVRALQGETLTAPLRWKKPRRVFVNSMSDLFHESLSDAAIDSVFAVMALCPQHTFQVLTKRPERMRNYLMLRNGMGKAVLCRAINNIPAQLGDRHGALEMPLPNVWLGVSVEDQARANERIPLLLQTPAAKRFISAEPLLGPIDLDKHLWRPASPDEMPGYALNDAPSADYVALLKPGLDWIIVGGESGPGARRFDIEWARSIVDQCRAAGVACFVKQLGANPTVIRPGSVNELQDVGLSDRKGGDPDQWPEDLRVREFPR